VWDRATGELLPDIRVVLQPREPSLDSLAFVSRSATEGLFALRSVPAGAFDVVAFQDRNGDRTLGETEAVGRADIPALGVADTVFLSVSLLVPDTTAAALVQTEVLDSTAVRVVFDDFVDPTRSLDGLATGLAPLPPDSAGVLPPQPDEALPEVARVFHEWEWDAYQDSIRAVADSLAILAADSAAAAADTVPAIPAVADTVAPGPPAREVEAGGVARVRRPAGGVRGPTPEPEVLPDGTPIPQPSVVLLLDGPLPPEITVEVRVQGITNLNGLDGARRIGHPGRTPGRAGRAWGPPPIGRIRRPGRSPPPPAPPGASSAGTLVVSDPRSRIPGVDRLLALPDAAVLLDEYSRRRVVEALRNAVDEARRRIATGRWEGDAADPGPYLMFASAWLRQDATPSLRRVVNATGVVLHTNLGRAPLAPAARDAMNQVGEGYSNLEYDLEAGARGSRYAHCVALLRELTGAEDALVVNNCAAGLVLSVAALARGRDVVVSRGELVEIGGGFRIPDMLRQAGARLREVGATNRVRLEDYEAAIRAGGVGALLKVHRSNFRIEGFTREVEPDELAALAREREIPLIYDLGSGLMVDPALLDLPGEPRPRDGVRSGATLVVFSGDKLLGGPQAGLVVGTSQAVSQLRSSPLCRAFRVDKGTLAGLEATLRLYRDPDEAVRRIPVLARLALSREELRQRCDALVARLSTRTAPLAALDTRSGEGRVGGGTYPGHTLPSWVVRVTPRRLTPDQLALRLRRGIPPLVGRVEGEAWVADLRTVAPEEEGALEKALLSALEREPDKGSDALVDPDRRAP
ncbi:MAG: L-seryl-tRNA(Sec) selenium transferase, partial [Gemmatimonadota bacterium]